MKLSRVEQKEYDRCKRRFIKYGFDIRERFASEWIERKEDDDAREKARKSLEEDGFVRVSCPCCAYPILLDKYDIQRIKEGKKKLVDFCDECPKHEIARIAHLDSPYKNSLYDSMGRVHLDMVGTGERRWQKGLREANRYSYDIPNESLYNRHNKEMAEYVSKRAQEELSLIERQYRLAPDNKKRWMCSELAPYIWILDSELSVDFHNCIRIYIGLPAETEKSYGLIISNKTCTIVTPPDKSEPAPVEIIQPVPIETPIPSTTPKVSVREIPKSLKDYFKSKGLTCVDKRPSGGCLWVIGSEEEIQECTDEACKLYDISGAFCNGGRATKNKRSWYTKDNK